MIQVRFKLAVLFSLAILVGAGTPAPADYGNAADVAAIRKVIQSEPQRACKVAHADRIVVVGSYALADVSCDFGGEELYAKRHGAWMHAVHGKPMVPACAIRDAGATLNLATQLLKRFGQYKNQLKEFPNCLKP
ncbi:MAG: hypothetical protein JO024_08860 [Candidatus Eremiobacteraeota bacterium]|nr:hypothetical protein [Candidatus Eremiobacteraeota bacterium]